MAFVEAGLRVARVQVQHPQRPGVEGERHGQDRVDVGGQKALRRSEVFVVAHVVAQDRYALTHDAQHDRAADLDRAARPGVLLQAENTGDLIGTLPQEEHGAPLRRHDLENRLQEPAFQRLDAADRVDRGADAHQDSEIARRAPGQRRGGRPGRRWGGLGQLDGASRHNPLVIQLHRVAARGRLYLLQQDQEDRVADPDLVAVREHALFDGNAVHERPVVAPQVGNRDARSLPLDDAVPARHPHAGEADLVARVTPDTEALFAQGNHVALPGPGDGREFRVHVSRKYTQSDSTSILLDSRLRHAVPSLLPLLWPLIHLKRGTVNGFHESMR